MKVFNYIKYHPEIKIIKINMNIYGSITILRNDILLKKSNQKILYSEIYKIKDSIIYIKIGLFD